MLKIIELFEIPIYRVSEDIYYEKLREYIANNTTEYTSDSYLKKKFGGDWIYNEVIGYFKFYRYDKRQIRCEYWETDASNKVKTRKPVCYRCRVSGHLWMTVRHGSGRREA